MMSELCKTCWKRIKLPNFCKYVAIFKCNDFEKEKDLLDFIVTHIEEFTQTVLDDEVISFEVELPITKQRVASPRGRRVDLFIKGKKKQKEKRKIK